MFSFLLLFCSAAPFEDTRTLMEEGKGRVCVTGATGFIGSWIIKRLLEDEHNKDVSFLTNLPGTSQKLQILKADLSKPESFKEAIEGCIGVFHVATPVDFEVGEAEEIVTKRAIDGALGILKACLCSKSVKRLVYTSSASAVCLNGRDDDDVMDESFWSDVDYLRTSKTFGWSYAVSKTLTEKAVLEFGEQNGLHVVTVVPTFVVGSFICPKLPSSIHASLSLAFGEKDPFALVQRHMVYVDDVARAHIFLLEHPNPKGRYNCSSCLSDIVKMSEFLSAKYPEIQTPTLDSLKEMKGGKLSGISTKKIKDAGFEFKYGFEEMVEETIQCCKEKGYL